MVTLTAIAHSDAARPIAESRGQERWEGTNDSHLAVRGKSPGRNVGKLADLQTPARLRCYHV